MQRYAVPRFDELLVPAVVALKAKGGSAATRKMLEWVAEYLRVSDELRARPALDVLIADGRCAEWGWWHCVCLR